MALDIEWGFVTFILFICQYPGALSVRMSKSNALGALGRPAKSAPKSSILGQRDRACAGGSGADLPTYCALSDRFRGVATASFSAGAFNHGQVFELRHGRHLRRNYRSLAAAFCHRTPLAHQFEAAFEHGTVVLHFILVPAAADTNRKRTFDNRSSEATSANRLSPA
jgi:hypothetical protein